MRLLFITQRMDPDDSNLGFVPGWIRQLGGLCEQIFVMAGFVGDLNLPNNIRVASLGKELGRSKQGRMLSFHLIVSDLIRDRMIDVVLAHMCPEYVLAAWPYARWSRIPIVLWYTQSGVSWQLWLAGKLVERVLTATPASCPIVGSKVRAIGHGIDTDFFVPAGPLRVDREKVVLTVGRISRIKRLEVLLEATAILKTGKVPNFRVRIVGDPVTAADRLYQKELRRQAEEYRIQDIVDFAGAIPYRQMASEYQVASVFVNLSQSLGIDKAVLEAMSCGVFPLTANPAFGSVLADLARAAVLETAEAGELAERLQHALAQSGDALRAEKVRRIVSESHGVKEFARRLAAECEAVLGDGRHGGAG